MKPSATYTMHATQRMHERGITQAHTQIVLKYGEINCDSYVLNQKNTQKTIHDLQKKLPKSNTIPTSIIAARFKNFKTNFG